MFASQDTLMTFQSFSVTREGLPYMTMTLRRADYWVEGSTQEMFVEHKLLKE